MALLDFFRNKKPAPKSQKGRSRNFHGAWNGAEVNNLTSSWTRTSLPINEQIYRDLETLRARSRDLAKNDVHVKKFIRLIKSNVVGRSGVVLQSKVKDANGSVDEAAVQAIEEAWKEFGEWGVANVKGQGTFVEMQNMFWDHILRDGEVLVLKIESPKYNRFGYSLQFLDPEVLNIKNNQELKNGHKVRMGVELDDAGRAVAYHLTSKDTTHNTFYEFHGQGYIRIPASKVIHRYLSEYADQVRGIPEIAVVMNRIKNLGGYEEAEVIGKRVSASKMGFFSRNQEGEGYEGEEDEEGVSMDASPGTLEEIPYGVDFHQFNPTHDGGTYETFVKTALKSVASGLGVSYHTLASDLEGVNYSSGRLGALEDRDFYMALQDWFIACFIKPIFKEWVYNAVMRRAITLSNGGTLRPTDIARYQQANFQGRRWLWVDPAKDMAANEKAITLNLTSRAAIIREQGRDPEDVFKEIAEEQKRLKELNINQPAEAGFLMPEEAEQSENEQD